MVAEQHLLLLRRCRRPLLLRHRPLLLWHRRLLVPQQQQQAVVGVAQ